MNGIKYLRIQKHILAFELLRSDELNRAYIYIINYIYYYNYIENVLNDVNKMYF